MKKSKRVTMQTAKHKFKFQLNFRPFLYFMGAILLGLAIEWVILNRYAHVNPVMLWRQATPAHDPALQSVATLRADNPLHDTYGVMPNPGAIQAKDKLTSAEAAVTASVDPSTLSKEMQTSEQQAKQGELAQDKYQPVSYDTLGGYYYPEQGISSSSTTNTKGIIPANVQALNGHRIAIEGFMVPIDEYGAAVHNFLLLRNQMTCCYGIPPKINEVIAVRSKDTGIPLTMDQPITIRGTLRVGEIRDPGANLLGLYLLDADGVGK